MIDSTRKNYHYFQITTITISTILTVSATIIIVLQEGIIITTASGVNHVSTHKF